MSISYVNSAQALSTSVSIPSHEQNDFILGIAISNGTSAPSVPSGQNWTTEISVDGFLNSGALFWKFADSSSESFGTATGADQVLVAIYKGVHRTDPFGDNAIGGGLSASVYQFDSLSLNVSDGSSWIIGWGYIESGSPTWGTISGTTKRMEASRIVFADTNGGVSSWSSASASLGGSFTTQNANFELKAQPFSGGFFGLM